MIRKHIYLTTFYRLINLEKSKNSSEYNVRTSLCSDENKNICKKSELRINNYYDYSEQKWLKVDETIERLNLNENKIKVLDCLISGKSLSETARTISCGVSTVFDRRAKLQKKYLSLIK